MARAVGLDVRTGDTGDAVGLTVGLVVGPDVVVSGGTVRPQHVCAQCVATTLSWQASANSSAAISSQRATPVSVAPELQSLGKGVGDDVVGDGVVGDGVVSDGGGAVGDGMVGDGTVGGADGVWPSTTEKPISAAHGPSVRMLPASTVMAS